MFKGQDLRSQVIPEVVRLSCVWQNIPWFRQKIVNEHNGRQSRATYCIENIGTSRVVAYVSSTFGKLTATGKLNLWDYRGVYLP